MDKIYTACDLISIRDYPCAINDTEGQKKAKESRDRDIKWAIARDLSYAERYESLGVNPLIALLSFAGLLAVMFLLSSI